MELKQDFDYRIFDSLIKKNVRFAIYRQAHQNDIHLILQSSQAAVSIGALTGLNDRRGFVIAPFRITENTPVILIEPEIELSGEKAVFDYLSDTTFETLALKSEIHGQSSLNDFSHYSEIFKIFHSALKDGGFQKLVLSRTYDKKRNDGFSSGVSFRKASEKYPKNFVFLCNTPETGTWMGVSPELLVAEQGDLYKTVALAGTRKLSVSQWDEKNRREQQIVADYMQQQLEKVSSRIEQRGPLTAQAGEIEHLKTKFSFNLKNGSKIGDLLQLLHPSPAVCGFPKEAAFDFIQENESYDRRYYSGFVGPLDIAERSRLYVNLRCMQIGNDVLRLYAGGGMLPSSELKSEWEETENKLQTILSILN